MAFKNAPEINAGSMADIAFLLLVFFLVTTTMDSELGMMRKLPVAEEVNPVKIPERNVLDIWINQDDIIMVEGKIIQIEQLSKVVKVFILNINNDVNLPEGRMVEVPFFGEVLVSKQVISLQNDNETSYGTYIQVQNELAKTYNELRNDFAKKRLGISFSKLKETNQLKKVAAIKSIYPQRISEAEPFEGSKK